LVRSSTFWVTGATSGLGLALVEQLLERGHRVAASTRDGHALDDQRQRHAQRLLELPGRLTSGEQTSEAARRLGDRWGSLDTLIINAGTCDYLEGDLQASGLFERILRSNRQATEAALGSALPLLAASQTPWVVGIFSHCSALPATKCGLSCPAGDNPLRWLRAQRACLQARRIDLSLVAPRSPTAPPSSVQTAPEYWTPESAASQILAQASTRHCELILDALNQNSLWPLS